MHAARPWCRLAAVAVLGIAVPPYTVLICTFEEGISLMAADIFAPCPCGSGKKFKFCCHAISDEMDRIIRLMEGNQPRVALQQLEQLAKKHPKNAWVGTTRAMLMLDLDEAPGARDVLKPLLEEHPDNELAIVL